MAWSKKIESIISSGIALHAAGINNWALSKEQALGALDKFEAEIISVLGGDVYELSGDKLESNCDSWYCDRNLDESFEKYVARSIRIARNYISNYSNSNQNKEYFVFVVE